MALRINGYNYIKKRRSTSNTTDPNALKDVLLYFALQVPGSNPSIKESQGRRSRQEHQDETEVGAMWKAYLPGTISYITHTAQTQLLTDGTTHSRKALYVNYPLRKCTINMPMGQANEGNFSQKVIPSFGCVKFKMQSNL